MRSLGKKSYRRDAVKRRRPARLAAGTVKITLLYRRSLDEAARLNGVGGRGPPHETFSW